MKNLFRCIEAVFLIAVLLLSSGAFAPLWIDVSSHDEAANAGNFTLQLVWAAIYVCVVLLLIPYFQSVLALLVGNWPLTLLTMLCIASAVWSENPSVTLRKAAALVGTTLLGILLAIRFELRGQIRLLATVLGIAAVAGLFASLFFSASFPPTEVALSAWSGVFSHKNMLGRSMALGALAFLSLDRNSRARYLLSISGAILCVIMLLVSHSQTAFVVLVVMLFLAGVSVILRLEWRQAVGSLLLLMLACAPLVWSAIAHAKEVAGMLHRDTTFTGRAKIWAFAALSFSKRPWLGYGYGTYWWVSNESRQALAFIRYKTPHAHNGFLDLGLQLGSIGVILFVLGWLIALVAALRHLRVAGTSEARWPLLFLLFIILYSVTETSLLVPNSLLWILYVAACASVTPPRQAPEPELP